MKRPTALAVSVFAAVLLASSALLLAARSTIAQPALGPEDGPRYSQGGRLIPPADYRTWVFVGASIGLGYNEPMQQSGNPGRFHHVYLQPAAYEHFQRTGTFPEKTMLVLEIYQSASKAPPSLQGYFEGERVAVEVAVKDGARFPEGWAYFDVTQGRPKRPFPAESCHRCHAEHAATDNVFTQFYPVLRQAHGAAAD